MAVKLSNNIVSLTSTYQTIRTCTNDQGEFVKLLFANVQPTITTKIYLRYFDISDSSYTDIIHNIDVESEQGQQVTIPIILKKDDYIQAKVDDPSMDNACMCTIAAFEPSAFFNLILSNRGIDLTTSLDTLFTAQAGYSAIARLFVSNHDSDYSRYAISIYDASASTERMIANNILLDPNTTEIIDHPFILEEGDKINIKKLSGASNVSVFASIEEKRN